MLPIKCSDFLFFNFPSVEQTKQVAQKYNLITAGIGNMVYNTDWRACSQYVEYIISTSNPADCGTDIGFALKEGFYIIDFSILDLYVYLSYLN